MMPVSFNSSFLFPLFIAFSMTATTAHSDNRAKIIQNGWSNQATTIQRDRRNVAVTIQSGSLNSATINQSGRGNVAAVAQAGEGFATSIEQEGNYQAEVVFQVDSQGEERQSTRTTGDERMSVTIRFEMR